MTPAELRAALQQKLAEVADLTELCPARLDLLRGADGLEAVRSGSEDATAALPGLEAVAQRLNFILARFLGAVVGEESPHNDERGGATREVG